MIKMIISQIMDIDEDKRKGGRMEGTLLRSLC